MNISNNLKKIMEKKEIKSIYQLVKLSGISQSTLSDIINEKTKNPRINIIIKLKKTLNCTYDDLLE